MYTRPGPELVEELRSGHLGETLEIAIGDHPSSQRLSAAAAALRLLLRPDRREATASAAVVQFDRLFPPAGKLAAPPYEAEYGPAHIFQKADLLADVAGFYRAFSLELGSAAKERPDHLALELEFLGFLLEKEAYALLQADSELATLTAEARGKFVTSHLGCWVGGFARALAREMPPPLYQAWTAFLEAVVAAEVELAGRPLESVRTDLTPNKLPEGMGGFCIGAPMIGPG